MKTSFQTPISLVIALFLCINWASCQNKESNTMTTVKELDINKYSGKWWEIARLPFYPERDLVNTSATYTILPNGKIEVLNQGYKYNLRGKHKKTKGKAWQPNPLDPGKLKVQFFWPFKSDYYIIALDQEEYQYALVSVPSGGLLWILSRRQTMPEDLYNKLLEIAKKNGIDVSNIIRVKHFDEKGNEL